MKYFNFKKQAGFTVLESIVAIFILSLAISGAFSATVRGISQLADTQDEVKAFYLAQEAVEIIKNKKNSNQLAMLSGSGISWLYGIAEDTFSPCYFNKVCRADAASASLVRCGDGWDTCPNLKQDSSSFVYNYSSGDDTRFKREIQIESITANEVSVTVKVKWSKGPLNREFKVKTHLFNWI